MARARPVSALAFAALLALPVAASTWWPTATEPGEPSTAQDTATYMWVNPNQEARDKVYFSGSLVPVSNTGTLFQFVAYLGYWRDCNGDGYVGNAMTGTESYAVTAFLIDQMVCPHGSPYFDGATVTEFRWLGPGSRQVPDPGALAWVDWGLDTDPWTGATPKARVDDQLTFSAFGAVPRWRGSQTWFIPSGPLQPGAAAVPGHATFYAQVTAAQDEAFPAGGARFTYGDPACQGGGLNWDCNQANWVSAVKVGQEFRLRDVDCYDRGQPQGHCA